MADKLREARQTYERLAAAARELEAVQQATLDAQREGQAQLAEFRKHVGEACGSALAECGRLRGEIAALQSEARYVGRSLRRPFLWGFLLVVLGGFIGSASNQLASDFAGMVWQAIFGP